MARKFDDFDTYTKGIWKKKAKIPGYAYFCWRWDEAHREEEGGRVKPRESNPMKDEKFRNDILNSFVYNQEMYHMQMEMILDKRSLTSSLHLILWNTYGHAPTRLLQMWRWARSFGADSMCGQRSQEGCLLPACKAWSHYYEKYASFEDDLDCRELYCQGRGAKGIEELDPSFNFFNEKLWKDTADRLKSELLDPGWHIHDETSRPLQSLQSFYTKLYEFLVWRTLNEAIEILQIRTNPNVSFLIAQEKESGHNDRGRARHRRGDKLPLILFAVAGSGKTQTIFNFLAVEWGHYLVSGQMSGDATNKSSILNPRGGGASGDTRWLFELFKRLKRKHRSSYPQNWYYEAITELRDNRRDFMDKWIKMVKHPSNVRRPQSIHWLLFQTCCTPKYDPLMETLKLRLLLGLYVDRYRFGRLRFPIPNIIIDKAQNELDPFWDEKPSLLHFIETPSLTSSVFSVSGTSLRLRECRKLVQNVFGLEYQTLYIEHQIAMLLRAFRKLIISQNDDLLSAELPAQLAMEDGNDISSRDQYIEVLRGPDFATILGLSYYTIALARAERTLSMDNQTSEEIQQSEEVQRILTTNATLLVDVVGKFHQEVFLSTQLPSSGAWRSSGNNQESMTLILQRLFISHHKLIWEGDTPINLPEGFTPTSAVSAFENILGERLREALTPYSLHQTPEASFRVIISNQCFSTLLIAHIGRILKRIGYFCSLGDETFKKEFWRIACPDTLVFQSTKNDDGTKEFFCRAKALLSNYVDTNAPKASEVQDAVQKAVEAFLQVFEDRQSSAISGQKCGITKHSTLFRGRIRWSRIYIEHVFATYLQTSLKDESDTVDNPSDRDDSKTMRKEHPMNIYQEGHVNDLLTHDSPDIIKDNIIPASIPDQNMKGGISEANNSDFETALNFRMPDPTFQIEEKAKEVAKWIKASLKDRIEMLKNKGHYHLLKDLYFTAIRAALIHKPTIFPSDAAASMISEGFALLDSTNVKEMHSTYTPKQWLSELIVVEAVVEYLQDNNRNNEDRLENVLQNFLFDSQDDTSSPHFTSLPPSLDQILSSASDLQIPKREFSALLKSRPERIAAKATLSS